MSEAFRPPKRGVGLVYTPLLHRMFVEHADLIDVAEIEPQTGWMATDPIDGPFQQVEGIHRLWSSLPQHRLLHSVAMPLAGLRPPAPAQMPLLSSLATEFGCSYVSEHLSVGGTPHQHAGFLLPPRQSEAGVAIAARNIRSLADGIGLPVAVETGVSYLPRFAGEMADGEYVRAVAEAADCGILFDIHNIYCNERNGRQSLDDFAAALPAERVWELHVAGGDERDGYWLDAHSGMPPDDLLAAAHRLVRGFPAVSAIIFEIYPSFLNSDSGAVLQRALGMLHELWSEVGAATSDGDLRQLPRVSHDPAVGPDPSDWEQGLTEAIRFRLPSAFGDDLALRPPVELYNMLAHSFRASSIIGLLPRSLRLLNLTGRDIEAAVLEFEHDVSPQLFALNEAEAFRAWAEARRGQFHPLLVPVIDYEIALIRVPLSGLPIVVTFTGDPQPLFEALAEGRSIPDRLEGAPWEIEITPDAMEDRPANGLMVS